MTNYLYGERPKKHWVPMSNAKMKELFLSHVGCLLEGPGAQVWDRWGKNWILAPGTTFILLKARKRSCYWILTVLNMETTKVEKYRIYDGYWYDFEILGYPE